MPSKVSSINLSPNYDLLRLYWITLMDAGVITLWIFALSEVLLNCVFCSIPADSETLNSCFFPCVSLASLTTQLFCVSA